MNQKRVALVHDWLVAQRGGENVLLELARLFPDAPIYTLVHEPGRIHPELERHPIHTSFIQTLPGAPRRFRPYLLLFPRAVESWDLSAYDAIISTSHCVAKGVILRPGQTHISYIHTPMRYLWDQLPQYLPKRGPRSLYKPLAERAVRRLRAWDVESAKRPTRLIANSHHVAHRIEQVWHRPATVVHPPVDVDCFAAAKAPNRRQGFVVVSALVPYKRVDLAVQLANARRLPLTIVGHGSELLRLKAMAGTTINFVPTIDRAALRDLYAHSEGLLFCGEEDFGIVPVEAMAAGCPVFAWRAGGLQETVVEGGERATGAFFEQQTLTSMQEGFAPFAARCKAQGWSRQALLDQARSFDVENFHRKMRACLGDLIPGTPVQEQQHAS